MQVFDGVLGVLDGQFWIASDPDDIGPDMFAAFVGQRNGLLGAPRRFACLLTVLAAVALAAGCGGGGTPSVSVAAPMHDVLVYAKAGPEVQGYLHLWVVGPTGNHARDVALGSQPQVSPDGRYVAYTGLSDVEVFVVPTAGGKPTSLGSGNTPIWAPNSRFVAFTRESGGLAIAHIGTRNRVTTITAAHGNVFNSVGTYAFSPDSQRIVYVKSHDLYVLPTSGGTPVRLTHGHDDNQPVWGTRGIAFLRFDDGRDIWLIDGRGHHAHRVTRGGSAWGLWPEFFSADGRELIAYAQPDPTAPPRSPANYGQLWAVALPSGQTRPLPVRRSIDALGLSRDGKTVLGANDSCSGKLETIPLAGGRPHVIYRGFGSCDASWNW